MLAGIDTGSVKSTANLIHVVTLLTYPTDTERLSLGGAWSVDMCCAPDERNLLE